MRIVAHYDPKPIPLRQFDWVAVDEDTYDGAPDSHCPIGYGRTEQEAIDDLREQMDDNAEAERERLKKLFEAEGFIVTPREVSP